LPFTSAKDGKFFVRELIFLVAKPLGKSEDQAAFFLVELLDNSAYLSLSSSGHML